VSEQAAEPDVLRVTGDITIKIDMPLSIGSNEEMNEVPSPEEAINWVLHKLCDLNCGTQDSSVVDALTVTEDVW